MLHFFLLDRNSQVMALKRVLLPLLKTYAGLDDLRDWTNNVQPCIPIYVAERDFEVESPVHISFR